VPQPVAAHVLLFAVAFPPLPLKDDIFGRQICLFKIAHREVWKAVAPSLAKPHATTKCS
jgi:hypothetical protein